MDENNVKTLSIEDFKANKQLALYMDEDFIMADGLGGYYYGPEVMRLDCFLLVLCLEGCVQVDIDERTCQLQGGDLFFGVPNTFINHFLASPDHKVRVVAFSSHFMQHAVRIEQRTWNAARYIHENPVIHIGGRMDEGFFGQNKDLIMMKIREDTHPYYKEMMQHIFTALFYEVFGFAAMKADNQQSEGAHFSEGMKPASHILRRFVEILSKDNGIHRSVAYYADAVCYSPKYFSKVIKQACGKSPLDMINQNAIEHIKYRLKHSQKSIKEISEEFNFPNQSFFGKYVKAHLGMSPKQYRDSQ